MIFDNINTENPNRLQTKVSINEDLTFFSSYTEEAINKMNESFFSESSSILLKETFGRTRKNYLFMNEAVEGFIDRFSNVLNDTINDIDNAFQKYAKVIAVKFNKDEDLIKKYSDEFLSSQNVKVKMYHYTITNGIPNYKFLNDLRNTSFNVNLQKTEFDKLKKYKKDDNYFKKLRGDILGLSGKSIKEEDFKNACWKIFRNNSEKQEVVEIEPKNKIEILKVIKSCESELKGLQNDLNIIKGFIQMNIKNILNEFSFISMNSETMSKLEYDAYTTFIYNKINEMRLLIKCYQTAFAYKMDVVKCRREDYMIIFKECIKHEGTINEDITEMLSNPNEYVVNTDNLEEELFSVGLDLESAQLANYIINEDVNILNEANLDKLKNVVKVMRETLNNLFNTFTNKAVPSFNKKFVSKEDFLKMDLSKFERKVFTYDLNKMTQVSNKINSASDSKNPDKLEDMMSDINAFRKQFFSGVAGSWNEKEDWSEFIKAQLRGSQITNPQQAINNAFAYCDDSTYESNRNKFASVKNKLDGILKDLDNEINKAKTQTNSSLAIQNNSAEIFSEEGEEDAMAQQKADNAEADVKNKETAEKASPDEADVNDKMNSVNGQSGKLNAIKSYYKELQKVEGYVWSIFEEGRREYITYLTKINQFQKMKSAVAKAKKKAGEVKEQVTTKVSSNNAVQNNSVDLLNSALNIDFLRYKAINESCKEISDETLFTVLNNILEETKLEEKIKRDISIYYSEGVMLDKVIKGYTNIFSNKLNKYIKDKDSILYK